VVGHRPPEADDARVGEGLLDAPEPRGSRHRVVVQDRHDLTTAGGQSLTQWRKMAGLCHIHHAHSLAALAGNKTRTLVVRAKNHQDLHGLRGQRMQSFEAALELPWTSIGRDDDTDVTHRAVP
jgi:hypothetical protein